MKRLKKEMTYFIFLVPSLLLFTFCVVYPFLSGIQLAFTDWNGISREYQYIGFDNFVKMLSDKNVVQPIKTTVIYGVGVTLLNNIFALFLAVNLSKKLKGKAFFKTTYFIPLAISAVLASFVWKYIDSNMISSILGRSLMGRRETVLIGIMIISLWNNLGSNVMIYMAGITGISKDYEEAAMIDGANGRQRFLNVTIPMLMPSFTICVTLTLTSSLREFGTVLAATGGGPAGSSQTVAILIYDYMFKYSRAGYAQAISLVFMVFLVVIGLVLTKFFRSKEIEA
ncbi:MAG: sugar ABC transporter permease [Eubacteriales bacterium]|nr:sugar ABC transporter permease [Eubacteriales bacterium]